MDATDPTTNYSAGNGYGASGDIAEQLREVIAAAEQLIDSAGNQGGEAIEELKARTRARIETARERLKTVEAGTRQRVNRAAHATDDYVTTNPWTAVAVAAAVGAVAAAVLTHRG